MTIWLLSICLFVCLSVASLLSQPRSGRHEGYHRCFLHRQKLHPVKFKRKLTRTRGVRKRTTLFPRVTVHNTYIIALLYAMTGACLVTFNVLTFVSVFYCRFFRVCNVFVYIICPGYELIL